MWFSLLCIHSAIVMNIFHCEPLPPIVQSYDENADCIVQGLVQNTKMFLKKIIANVTIEGLHWINYCSDCWSQFSKMKWVSLWSKGVLVFVLLHVSGMHPAPDHLSYELQRCCSFCTWAWYIIIWNIYALNWQGEVTNHRLSSFAGQRHCRDFFLYRLRLYYIADRAQHQMI